jgi:hypothetical protein
MAGRPLTYQSEDERPVSISVRVPKALYDQAQHYASMWRMTLTELLLGGLRLRLETPADPRELLASDNGNTVMQQLQEMVDTAVQAALARMQGTAPAAPMSPTGDSRPASVVVPYDNGNTVLQESAPAMKQCGKGHAPYPASKAECPHCVRERTREYRQRKAAQRRGEIPA